MQCINCSHKAICKLVDVRQSIEEEMNVVIKKRFEEPMNSTNPLPFALTCKCFTCTGLGDFLHL